MRDAETLSAAIAHLEAIQKRPDIVAQFSINVDDPEAFEYWSRIRERIERDHRTLDAQIALLQRSLDWYSEEAMSYIGPEDLALARAILGEQVDA